ncbi:hypothetical protein MTO96_051721 [Rhipicephalus appendiculatus]
MDAEHTRGTPVQEAPRPCTARKRGINPSDTEDVELHSVQQYHPSDEFKHRAKLEGEEEHCQRDPVFFGQYSDYDIKALALAAHHHIRPRKIAEQLKLVEKASTIPFSELKRAH